MMILLHFECLFETSIKFIKGSGNFYTFAKMKGRNGLISDSYFFSILKNYFDIRLDFNTKKPLLENLCSPIPIYCTATKVAKWD